MSFWKRLFGDGSKPPTPANKTQPQCDQQQCDHKWGGWEPLEDSAIGNEFGLEMRICPLCGAMDTKRTAISVNTQQSQALDKMAEILKRSTAVSPTKSDLPKHTPNPP